MNYPEHFKVDALQGLKYIFGGYFTRIQICKEYGK